MCGEDVLVVEGAGSSVCMINLIHMEYDKTILLYDNTKTTTHC